MSQRIVVALLYCGIISILATRAGAGIIEVSLKTPSPLPSSNPRAIPVVFDGNRSLKGTEHDGSWSFGLDASDKLLWELTVKLSAAPTPGYEYGPLVAYIPYSRALLAKQVDRIAIAVVRTGHEVVDAQRIWSRDVQRMSRESLQETYQQARAIAFGRMAEQNGNWSALDDYDVVSVYKYLETAVALAKKTSIAPPNDDLNQACEWYTDALKNRKDQVYRALGSRVLANSLLPAVDQIDGARLANLWNTINLEPIPRRCHLLEEYYDLLRNSDVVVPGIDVGHVAAAISQCRVNATHGAKLTAAEAAGLNKRNRDALQFTASVKMETRLQKDIATISGLSEKPPAQK